MVGNRESPEENRKHQEVEVKLEFGQSLLCGCARTEAASPSPKSDKNHSLYSMTINRKNYKGRKKLEEQLDKKARKLK